MPSKIRTPYLRPGPTARERNRDEIPHAARVIRESAERSRKNLGVEKIDLLYAHTQDRRVPMEETVEAFTGLVADDSVGLLGVSNHWAWQVERARALARDAGLPGQEVLQYHHSCLRRRTDFPSRRSPVGQEGVVSGELLSCLRSAPGLPLVAYSPLLSGAYVREDKPLGSDFDHAGTPVRPAALHEVAKGAGATVNQVVPAWLIGGEVPMIPLVGASSGRS